jgi:hypothetical protein
MPNENEDSMLEDKESARDHNGQSNGRPYDFSFKGSFRGTSGNNTNNIFTLSNDGDSVTGRASSNFPKVEEKTTTTSKWKSAALLEKMN